MRVVRLIGRELSYAAPSELTIGNLVRRVLFLIREEHAHHYMTGAPQQYVFFLIGCLTLFILFIYLFFDFFPHFFQGTRKSWCKSQRKFL
jgi:hypothetical protein